MFVLFIGGMRKIYPSKIFSLKTHSDISSRNLNVMNIFITFFFCLFSFPTVL